MDGFERMKEQSRRTILDAALELFKTYGFKKASISDIAQRAGVSPVTIYNHFGSKEGLIREAVKALLRDMVDRYRGIIEGEGTFPEKMQAIIFDKTEIGSQFRGELAERVYRDDPQLAEYVEKLFIEATNRNIIEMLNQGKTEGYVSSGLSEDVLLTYVKVLRNGLAANPEVLNELGANVEKLRELNLLFLYGFMGMPPARRE